MGVKHTDTPTEEVIILEKLIHIGGCFERH